MKKLFATIVLAFTCIALFANEKPEFPGGESALKKFLNENVKYPEIAQENGVEGIVVVGFLVDTNGALQDIKVKNFIDPDLENEALRVVKIMPAWIPAAQDGVNIEAVSQVEVPFILD